MDDQNWGQVTLIIPCAPEYVGTARLAILGIGSRMGFSYDQIEDIRLAVGEACTNAIERAGRFVPDPARGPAMTTIRCNIEPTRLTVEIEDNVPTTGTEATELDVNRPAGDVPEMNTQELGALLMEILVDEVAVETVPGGGTRVRLIKFANAN